MSSSNNDFLLFWLWEYTRRSNANVKEFQKLLIARNDPQEHEFRIMTGIDDTMANLPLHDWGHFNIKNWGIVSGNSDIYETADAIIENFIKGTLDYKYPPPDIDWPGLKKLEDDGARETLKYNAQHFEEARIIKQIDPVIDFITGKGKGSPGSFFFIDMTRPLEELQKRLEYEYSRYKSPKDEHSRKELTSDLINQWAKGRSDGSRPRRDSNTGRMLGLCMWDYANNHQCTQEQAAEHVREQYIERLDVNTDPFKIKRLCHFHTRTKQCIETGRFLNFS